MVAASGEAMYICKSLNTLSWSVPRLFLQSVGCSWFVQGRRALQALAELQM